MDGRDGAFGMMSLIAQMGVPVDWFGLLFECLLCKREFQTDHATRALFCDIATRTF